MADLTLARALETADDEARAVLQELNDRVASVSQEQESFREWCARADALYYANEFTRWGADLWPDDPSATTEGMSHVSVNTPAVYVDIPAALQAIQPVENMLATGTDEKAREAAAALERVYEAWKLADEFELKFNKACVVKGLYGRTAGRPYWDDRLKRVCLEIIERPQRLYLGYQSDTYNVLDWAAYQMRLTPNAVRRTYHVDVVDRTVQGVTAPAVIVGAGTADGSDDRPWINYSGDSRIEVWDYWFREWDGAKGSLVTRNVVLAGNAIVRGPTTYEEYEGEIPYIPLYNTFVPNAPRGRSSLHDVEPLLREKYERITSGSQMIASGTAGDYWQLTGQDAPSRVPPTLQVRRNEIAAPGPGNRIETIQPFIAQFQLEQYLVRIDRELEAISGLNDLVLGHAPASVLGSSRAVNALMAQYELRLKMTRMLLYSWRRKAWEMSLKVWVHYDSTVKAIVAHGGGTLDILDPTLSPRDELDTAAKAGNLMNSKIWSQRRAMDAVGVDDPETEQEMIREERTDATMFPQEVQVMAQLLEVLKNSGVQPPGNVQSQAQAQAGTAQAALRNALGAATPQNTEAAQAPAEQGATPPGALQPGATPPAGPFAQGPQTQLQGMIQNGKASGRILTQQQIGRK